MNNFLVIDNLLNLQLEHNRKSWFMVVDKDGNEYLEPATSKFHLLDNGSDWVITKRVTKNSGLIKEKVTSKSLYGILDYVSMDLITKNYQVFISNDTTSILVTDAS